MAFSWETFQVAPKKLALVESPKEKPKWKVWKTDPLRPYGMQLPWIAATYITRWPFAKAVSVPGAWPSPPGLKVSNSWRKAFTMSILENSWVFPCRCHGVFAEENTKTTKEGHCGLVMLPDFGWSEVFQAWLFHWTHFRGTQPIGWMNECRRNRWHLKFQYSLVRREGNTELVNKQPLRIQTNWWSCYQSPTIIMITDKNYAGISI